MWLLVGQAQGEYLQGGREVISLLPNEVPDNLEGRVGFMHSGEQMTGFNSTKKQLEPCFS